MHSRNLIGCLLIICMLCGLALALIGYRRPNARRAAVDAPQTLSFAVLVQTNLVRQNCPCGFCDPSRGIAVPEHINALGYDLRLVVSTNYLPIVFK